MNHRDRLAIETFRAIPYDEIQSFTERYLIDKIASDEICIVDKLANDEHYYVGSPEHCDDCKAFWEDRKDLWLFLTRL